MNSWTDPFAPFDQPHWRQSNRLEGIEPVVFTNQRPDYKSKDLTS